MEKTINEPLKHNFSQLWQKKPPDFILQKVSLIVHRKQGMNNVTPQKHFSLLWLKVQHMQMIKLQNFLLKLYLHNQDLKSIQKHYIFC